jgi:hypothetical protein
MRTLGFGLSLCFGHLANTGVSDQDLVVTRRPLRL